VASVVVVPRAAGTGGIVDVSDGCDETGVGGFSDQCVGYRDGCGECRGPPVGREVDDGWLAGGRAVVSEQDGRSTSASAA
jgi:hypothetical protein